MTISSTIRKAGPFNGTGAQTAFPFAFKVFATTDLRVVLTDASGLEVDQVLTTGYTVALNADQNVNAGGTVTMLAPPAEGYKLTLTSAVPATQGQSIPNNGGFYPKVIENAYDKLTILVQQITEQVGRSVKFAISDTSTGNNMPPAAQRANNLLGFDSNGNMIAVAPAAQSATALQSLLGTSAGSSLIGYIQAGIGAVLRTIQNKLRETRSIEDFGATAGAADNAVAIQKAIDSLIAVGGGQLIIPDKNYNTSRLVIDGGARIKIIGQGDNATLNFLGAATDMLTVRNSIFITFEGFRVESATVPAAGSIFSFDNCAWVYLDRLVIGYYSRINRGIAITNVLGGVQGVYVSRTLIFRHEAEAILVSATNANAVINDIYFRDIWTQWIADTGYPLVAAACVGFKFVRSAGALQAVNMSNCTGSAQAFAMSAYGVRFLAVTDSYFDGYTFMERCDLGSIKGSWFSGGGAGTGTQLNAHEFRGGNAFTFAGNVYIPAGVASSAGATIAVQPSAGVLSTNIMWDSCTIAGAGYRGLVVIGGDKITLRGLNIGSNGGLYPNVNNIVTGVDIQNTMTGRLTVTGGDMSEITTPILNNHPDKTKVSISGVGGFNPVKSLTAPVMIASGGGWTNNLGFRVRIWVNGGTGVTVYVNGQPIASGATMLILAPGEAMALIYTTAPTWAFQGD